MKSETTPPLRPLVVVADGFSPELFGKLSADPLFNVHPQKLLSREELVALGDGPCALVVRSATQVDKELLAALPKLALVIRAGEGTDNIDKALCAQKGIAVANTPGANNNSAAEHAIALMMTVLRHTAQASSRLKAGGWDKSQFMGRELTGKKLGLVGLGRVGQLVAKRLAGFEMDIRYFDPFVAAGTTPWQRVDSLEELLKNSDLVGLHVPKTPQTQGMIGRRELGFLRPESILINAARGGIVDEVALEELLREKKIGGAGFDVFATEPLPANSPLRQLDNLVLTPHLGASTQEAQERVGKMVIAELREFFEHHQLLHPVHPVHPVVSAT